MKKTKLQLNEVSGVRRFYTSPDEWEINLLDNTNYETVDDIFAAELEAMPSWKTLLNKIAGSFDWKRQLKRDIEKEMNIQRTNRSALKHNRDMEPERRRQDKARTEMDAYRKRKEEERRKSQAEFDRRVWAQTAKERSALDKKRADMAAADEYYEKHPEERWKRGKVPKRNRWGVITYVDPDQPAMGIDESKEIDIKITKEQLKQFIIEEIGFVMNKDNSRLFEKLSEQAPSTAHTIDLDNTKIK